MACVQNSNTNGPCPQWAFSASTNQITTSGFAYDAAGNLTTDGSTTRNYTWDAEGRLTQVTDNSDGTSTTYAYNALGQRAELVTTDYQLEQIFNPAGARVGYASVASGSYQWLAAYVPWGGRELAEYSTGTVFYFLHANALGSGTITTNAGGGASSDILYYPWGQEWAQWSGTYDTHFAGMHAGLQGSPLADFTMYEAPFRFYASSLGRWHSPDPLAGDITNPQSLNRYPYVLNSPTTLTDPLGLQGCPAGTSEIGPGQCAGNAAQLFWYQYGIPLQGGAPWDMDPADFPCAYVPTSDASCGQPPGLWPNGTPIFGPAGGAWGGGGGGGGGFGTSPLSGDFGPLGPMSLGQALWPESWSQPGCEFGPCMPSETESFAPCQSTPSSTAGTVLKAGAQIVGGLAATAAGVSYAYATGGLGAFLGGGAVAALGLNSAFTGANTLLGVAGVRSFRFPTVMTYLLGGTRATAALGAITGLLTPVPAIAALAAVKVVNIYNAGLTACGGGGTGTGGAN